MKYSASEENYIKAIYHLQNPEGAVTTNALAAKLETKAASVSDMLRKLKAKKLLIYEKYKGFKLSNEGKKIALMIIRKHRLWEYFLVQKLDFGWDQVHEIAEQLEHINSAVLIAKLDHFLSFPKFDPHGDPIPDINGKMEINKQIKLTDLSINTSAEVTAVGNQSSELLELLRHKNISIGTRLEVKRKFSYDNSFEIKIKNVSPFSISQQLAHTLFVKLL